MTIRFTGANGEFGFLSNFYELPFEYLGRMWSTSEHAYQAQKTTNMAVQETIRKLVTPGKAKKWGQSVILREGWETLKIPVMKGILGRKFAVPELRDKLLATGIEPLIEFTYWGDTFWGVNTKLEGTNHLGILLMMVRDEIRDNS